MFQADKSYTASAVLDGAELSYFGQEGLSEVIIYISSKIQTQCCDTICISDLPDPDLISYFLGFFWNLSHLTVIEGPLCTQSAYH